MTNKELFGSSVNPGNFVFLSKTDSYGLARKKIIKRKINLKVILDARKPFSNLLSFTVICGSKEC